MDLYRTLRLSWAAALALALGGLAAAAEQAGAPKPPPAGTATGRAAATPADASPIARGKTAWLHLETRTAVDLLTQAAAASTGARKAEAELALGDIYYTRGWEQEDSFGGWHVEPDIRPAAIEAYRAAAAACPEWSAPHERLGRALLKDERADEALKEFDAALAKDPNDGNARYGRWQALVALGQKDRVAPEVEKAAAATGVGLLYATYRGHQLLGDKEKAAAAGDKVVATAPGSEMAASVLADRIDAARTAADNAGVIAQATAFISKYPRHPRTRTVYDALIAAYQATPDAPVAAVEKAIDGRLALVADPQASLGAANLLIARKDYDKAIAIARATPAAAEKFIDQNHSAYRLDDKARNALNRFRASSSDAIGWALFHKKQVAAAEEKLAEADRLARSQDASTQFHLGELARAKGQLETARDEYLNVLTLAAPPPVTEAAKKSLAEVYAKLDGAPAEFDAYVAKEIARRRDERRDSLVTNMEDQRAPALHLTNVSGPLVDVAALRGKVLLLNFFTSW